MKVSLAKFIKVFGYGKDAKRLAEKYGTSFELENVSDGIYGHLTKKELAQNIINGLEHDELKKLAEEFGITYCDTCAARGFLNPDIRAKLVDKHTKEELTKMLASSLLVELNKEEEV